MLERSENIQVRGYGLSMAPSPLTRIAPQSDLSPVGRGDSGT
jgi:hypothetical protein